MPASSTTGTNKDPRVAGQLNARVLNSTNPYEEIEMPTTKINASPTDTPSPVVARSIWKKDNGYADLFDGPATRLNDVEFHLSAEYSKDDGVHFFGNMERSSETYTLAEVRKIHRAMGRLLDKVDAEPKPKTNEVEGAQR
jgi:hypothetical protein